MRLLRNPAFGDCLRKPSTAARPFRKKSRASRSPVPTGSCASLRARRRPVGPGQRRRPLHFGCYPKAALRYTCHRSGQRCQCGWGFWQGQDPYLTKYCWRNLISSAISTINYYFKTAQTIFYSHRAFTKFNISSWSIINTFCFTQASRINQPHWFMHLFFNSNFELIR